MVNLRKISPFKAYIAKAMETERVRRHGFFCYRVTDDARVQVTVYDGGRPVCGFIGDFARALGFIARHDKGVCE
jgi:hypothetical protein